MRVCSMYSVSYMKTLPGLKVLGFGFKDLGLGV